MLRALPYAQTRFLQLSFAYLDALGRGLLLGVLLLNLILVIEPMVFCTSLSDDIPVLNGAVLAETQDWVGTDASNTAMILLLTVYINIFAMLFLEPGITKQDELLRRNFHRTEADALRVRLTGDGPALAQWSVRQLVAGTVVSAVAGEDRRYYLGEGKERSGGREASNEGRGDEGSEEEKMAPGTRESPFCVETALEMLTSAYHAYFDMDHTSTLDRAGAGEEEKFATTAVGMGEEKKAAREAADTRPIRLPRLRGPRLRSPFGVHRECPLQPSSHGYHLCAGGFSDTTDTHWEIVWRPGRNRVVVAIRGTVMSSILNWKTNCQCLAQDSATWLFQEDQRRVLEDDDDDGDDDDHCTVCYDKGGEAVPPGNVRRTSSVRSNTSASSLSGTGQLPLLRSASSTATPRGSASFAVRRSTSKREHSVPLLPIITPTRGADRDGEGSRESFPNVFEMLADAARVGEKAAHSLLKPQIHVGFANAYLSVRKPLRAALLRVLHDRCDPSVPVDVYFTGHSLGGALATLAALDTSLWLGARGQCDPRDVVAPCVCAREWIVPHIYTYGAPRVGNHHFAQMLNEIVSDSWRVVLDGDPVTSVPKLYFLGNMYKHAGRQALVDKLGNLIVDPLHVERLLRAEKKSFLSITAAGRHSLDTYHDVLVAVYGEEDDDDDEEEEEE